MAEIALRQVGKRFGEVEAVRDLTLSVANGEFVVLLGPTGAGKTTTLRLIAGLDMPSSGTIRFNGADITDVPPTHRDMRLVFQDFALFPNLSAYDNVAFGLRLRIARGRFPKGEVDRRVKRFLDIVHLGDQSQKMPHQLSGGQKQRVALARALATDPQIVLFDEPLGSLDANLRKAMQLELKHIHRELGRTFIYVTHDQDEAMTMSDRVAVMQNAQLLQVGSPEEIYMRPNCEAVARFIGAANILAGEVESVAGGIAAVRLPDGGLVRACAPDGSAARGSPARLMMRSEHFVFDRARAGADINWLTGRVTERLFLGRSIEYRVTLDPSGELLSVLDQRQEAPPPLCDGKLEFGIDPAHVRLLAS